MNRKYIRLHTRAALTLLCAAGLAACGGGHGAEEPQTEVASERVGGGAAPGDEDPLAVTLARATALADSIEDLLRPVPLLRPAQEAALRRHLNAAHVSRARQLGVRPADEAEVERLVREGRLVQLPDSTSHWIVRRGAAAYVTPDTRRLLERIAERFQSRIQERGLPPYRLEISSVLRTAAGQAALRRRNPNAAAGISSHEFGTTLDIVYEAYAPPAPLPEGLVPDAPPEMEPHLERVAALALESVSARKSRELQAILGQVLIDMQAAGDVLVILERQQPVYHITLGRPQPER